MVLALASNQLGPDSQMGARGREAGRPLQGGFSGLYICRCFVFGGFGCKMAASVRCGLGYMIGSWVTLMGLGLLFQFNPRPQNPTSQPRPAHLTRLCPPLAFSEESRFALELTAPSFSWQLASFRLLTFLNHEVKNGIACDVEFQGSVVATGLGWGLVRAIDVLDSVRADGFAR